MSIPEFLHWSFAAADGKTIVGGGTFLIVQIYILSWNAVFGASHVLYPQV
jgi:hypothetical protein